MLYDQQYTWLAATSNDELGQDESKVALTLVEEVHQQVDIHFPHVSEDGASLDVLPWLCMGHSTGSFTGIDKNVSFNQRQVGGFNEVSSGDL